MTESRNFDASRRRLLKRGAAGALATSAPFVTTLQAFAQRQAASHQINSSLTESPYGPVRPVKDDTTGLELLQLPEGFSYTSFSWTGDLMEDGNPVPGAHDGMGVVGLTDDGKQIILIRNHELGSTADLIHAPAIYDNAELPEGHRPGGGNTNIFFPLDGSKITTIPSLGGTRANCAGGTTPWGTWLSCEENVADHSAEGGRPHGYVFEVTADPALTSGRPIIGMGRYKHEAVAVDPVNSFVYLTEDNRNMSPIYRFVPHDRSQQLGSLERGGRLQAAKIRGIHFAELLAPQLGDAYELEWVDIDDPDMATDENGASGPYLQARAAGALSISRGEGIWYHEGMMYIVHTSAGLNARGEPGRGEGAVWMLDTARNKITCIFASPDAVVSNNPDNITVSPRGGVVLCEDGGGVEDEFGFGERLMGLKPTGETFIFAKNNVILSEEEISAAGKNVSAGDFRNQEFAGATFDPDGNILFFNLQTPGITFAIRGPWEKGPF
jgi:secreted PhoX family phosphatase